jgi:tRNA splicing endonuclease
MEKAQKDPVTIQYALSQCHLPTDSTTKGFGNSRLYPKDEVQDFYNHLKAEGYVPPKGFEEGTKEVTDLQGSLSDIGL